MAVAFDTTVGGASATSYPTLSDASDYLTVRPGASSWFDLDSTSQEHYLIYGTQQLDLLAEYDGTMADTVTPQNLRWPRVEAYDCDGVEAESTVVPVEIKNAATELAFYYVGQDRLAIPKLIGQGFSKAKVGPISVEVDRDYQFARATDDVNYLLGCYGEIVKGMHDIVTQGLAFRG